MSIQLFLARVASLTSPDVDRVAVGLRAANEALTLAERLHNIFTPDPKRRAARLRGRAARLLARAETASPRRAVAVALRARAAGLIAEAEALEA